MHQNNYKIENSFVMNNFIMNLTKINLNHQNSFTLKIIKIRINIYFDK